MKIAVSRHPDLLDELIALEKELHRAGVACSSERAAEILHDNFHEVGKSGVVYSRADILRFFSETPNVSAVVSSNYALQSLAENVALLTYASEHQSDQGSTIALRSSIWLKDDGRWRLYYHQGTVAM